MLYWLGYLPVLRSIKLDLLLERTMLDWEGFPVRGRTGKPVDGDLQR